MDLRSVSCTMICTFMRNIGQGSTQQQQQFQPSADTSLVQKGTDERSPAVSRMKKITPAKAAITSFLLPREREVPGSAFCIDDQAGNSKEEKKMKDRTEAACKASPLCQLVSVKQRAS